MVFLFGVLRVLVAFNATLMLSTNICVRSETFIPIDVRWCQSIIDSLADFLRAVNLSPNIELFNVVWCFDGHVVGVDPLTTLLHCTCFKCHYLFYFVRKNISFKKYHQNSYFVLLQSCWLFNKTRFINNNKNQRTVDIKNHGTYL